MEDADILIEKGIELYNSRNLEEAIKYFAEAARLDPENDIAFKKCGDALSDLALLNKDESLFKESFEKYKQATHIKPKNADALVNWGNALSDLAKIQTNESLFRESFKKYEEATQIEQKSALAFYNWGTALSDLALIKKNELLFKESFEKYKQATQEKKKYIEALNNWGNALSDLALLNRDESLFKESFEKFKQAARIKPGDTDVFVNWGIALSELAIIEPNEIFLKESFKLFYRESDSFKKLNMDILEIFVLFGNEGMKKIIKVELFYPLLDSVTDDSRFLKEATKEIKEELEKDEEKKRKYQKVYILSILIISQLHVNNEDEKFVATYRDKTITQRILFEDQTDPNDPKKAKDLKFRLNAINYSNDPTEGKILFDYIFDDDKRPADKALNREYSAFAGCFIFNRDSLNQFRLYGKEKDREGTGLSLVFQERFFSENAKMAMKQPKTEEGNTDGEEEKHALFRCIYIDPETQRVETVGHKEEYLFYRENHKKEKDEVIRKKWESYHEYITNIIINVRKEMGELKKLAMDKDLKPAIVGQLLINLRYLTKHIAFKEEQECRIIKIYRLNDKKIEIKTSEDFKQMYVEYQPKVSAYVEEIYFGPKADGIELFQDMLIHKGLTRIHCYKSKNPLA